MQYCITDFGNWEWGIAVNKTPKRGSALGTVQREEAGRARKILRRVNENLICLEWTVSSDTDFEETTNGVLRK